MFSFLDYLLCKDYYGEGNT